MKLIEGTQINWAQSIAHRREAQTRLNMLHDSLRLLESRVIQQMEENNEKIAILQSLMDKPGDGSEIVSKREERELESHFKHSQQELAEAEHLQADFTSVESFSCNVLLRNASADGLSYGLKFLEEKLLSFENSSVHGPCIGAAMSVLTLILRLTKECNLWEPVGNVEMSSLLRSTSSSARSDVLLDEPDSDVNRPLLGLLSLALQNPIRQHQHQQQQSADDLCFVQFSVNGVLKKQVVIKLEREHAPSMCSHFYKYCHSNSTLHYQGSPIMLVYKSFLSSSPSIF